MKKIFLKFASYLAVLPILLLPVSVLAKIETSADLLVKVGTATEGAVPTKLPETIGKLIQVVLSVLGIVFLVIVVYAGFLYLTAGGEDEKVKTAKKLLSQAVIGIVIVILSFAISTFVIDRLTSISSAQPVGGGNDSPQKKLDNIIKGN